MFSVAEEHTSTPQQHHRASLIFKIIIIIIIIYVTTNYFYYYFLMLLRLVTPLDGYLHGRTNSRVRRPQKTSDVRVHADKYRVAFSRCLRVQTRSSHTGNRTRAANVKGWSPNHKTLLENAYVLQSISDPQQLYIPKVRRILKIVTNKKPAFYLNGGHYGHALKRVFGAKSELVITK